MSFVNQIKKRMFLAGKNMIANILFYKQKEILVIPESARFGNHLYFFLNTSIQREKGKNTYIQFNKNMVYWLEAFPSLKTFVINDREINFLDKKCMSKMFYQYYGKDFRSSDIKRFVNEHFSHLSADEHSYSGDLVVNVRRGDFYSTEHVSMYGFDQETYLQNALKQVKNPDEIKVLTVVSDDIEWCKSNLRFLSAYSNHITYQENDPYLNFCTLANAKKLIISNSTFAYWGAYLNENLNAQYEIFAPNFNARHISDGKLIQRSANWKVIEI